MNNINWLQMKFLKSSSYLLYRRVSPGLVREPELVVCRMIFFDDESTPHSLNSQIHLVRLVGKGKWKQSKRAFVQSKIDTFCNLNRIDLETVTLWTDKKMTSITLFDENDTAKKDVPSTKPWWKFW